MLRLDIWEEDEGPTESSEVWDFPAPLAHGLGEDCEELAGLQMDEGWAEIKTEKKKTEFVSLAISLLLQLVPFIPLCSPLFWFMRARGKVIWGKRTEHWAYVAPQRTLAVLDTIWGSHACGGRGETERSDYKWWLSHLEEQQVQASCGRNGWIDGWRTGSRDGWMVRTIGGEKKRSYMQHLKWRIQLVKAKK